MIVMMAATKPIAVSDGILFIFVCQVFISCCRQVYLSTPHPSSCNPHRTRAYWMIARGGLSCRLKPTRFVARWRSLRRRQSQSELCSVSHTSPPFLSIIKLGKIKFLSFFFTFPSHIISGKTSFCIEFFLVLPSLGHESRHKCVGLFETNKKVRRRPSCFEERKVPRVPPTSAFTSVLLAY